VLSEVSEMSDPEVTKPRRARVSEALREAEGGTMTPDEMKEHETARGDPPNAGSVRNKPRLAKSS
jgi:hypothetical protein